MVLEQAFENSGVENSSKGTNALPEPLFVQGPFAGLDTLHSQFNHFFFEPSRLQKQGEKLFFSLLISSTGGLLFIPVSHLKR